LAHSGFIFILMKAMNHRTFMWPRRVVNANFGWSLSERARNKGVASHVIRDIEKLVFQHWALLREKYYEYHHR